jgi:hypothetical protein
MVRATWVWVVSLLGAGSGLASAAPHTFEELVRPSLVRDIALSPDGKHVAVAHGIEGKDQDVVVSESYLYWVKSIGDPKADKAAIDAASPRLRAIAFLAPLLNN